MRSTLTVEEQFERELEIFRTEAETAAQFFYAFLAIQRQPGRRSSSTTRPMCRALGRIRTRVPETSGICRQSPPR